MPELDMTPEASRLISNTIMEKLASRDPVLLKEAEDLVTAYTRTKMREDGFYRKMVPIVPVQNDNLTRRVDTDKPVIVVDKEPDSPAALSVAFATLPDNLYIHGDRYEVTFERIVTPRFTKDVDELRTWEMDIRQVLSDNAIKDILAEEDGKLLRAVNTAIVGPDLVVPTSGTVQYQTLHGGITRDNLCESLKVMPNTPSSIEVHNGLVNNITVKDFMKFTHNEAGGTMSEEIFKNGWSLQHFLGIDWFVTIKKGLVATNSAYHFGDPKFIGKFYELEPTTLYIRREAFMLEFFAYESIGGTIGHTSAVARVDFA